MKFHIDPNSGDPIKCDKWENCPWAPPEEHYDSPDATRNAYENLMGDFLYAHMRRNYEGDHQLEPLKPKGT